MDEKRKNIIIKKIKNWKQSKLLPDHYCDFLLTLYTEGEQFTKEKERNQFNLLIGQSFISFIMVQSLFVLAVLVIYFTDFSLIMQIAIVIPFSLALLLIATKTINSIFSSIYYMNTALLLFLLTNKMVSVVTNGNVTLIMAFTMLHCIVWILAGWKWSNRIFTVAGAIGLFLLFYFMVR
ncbi:hypothetical protein ACFFHM_23995 [Halalkalibacter kiskunsagensis]|uniref:Yip1 domain-containing protein n=1 Tax=Halalkalibacter kiskunsagensis TaxID=1548599 RepID=A0ABV6KJI5_9BACI